MSDRTFYDEAFFAELEQPKPLRKQVVDGIRRYCALNGSTHSIAWRKAYLELEGAISFRVPDKKGLDAVEKEGLMQQLLEVVKKLADECGDHATEVNNAIPDYIPYESDRSRWKANATKPCEHEWGVFSTRTRPCSSNPYQLQHSDRVELLPGNH